jgi:hypothetical protein
MHAFECPCPAIEDWLAHHVDPYAPGSAAVAVIKLITE